MSTYFASFTGDRARVFTSVDDERDRQDTKWGEQNITPIEWLAVLTEEVGEAAQESLRWRFKHEGPGQEEALRNLRTELIQCAAVAVAAVECLDRGKWRDNRNAVHLSDKAARKVYDDAAD